MMRSVTWKFAVAVGATLLSLATTIPVAGAAARAPRPQVLSVTVTPKTLAASGGTVLVAVRDRDATRCTITVVPKVASLANSFGCATGHFVAAVKISKNVTSLGRAIHFQVVAFGPGGRSPVRVALVSQTRAPRPQVLSVTVTPKTLAASGGTVLVAVRDRDATRCTITVVPKVASLANSFGCATGHFVAAVKISKNETLLGQIIHFQVVAFGPGGRSPARVALVSQATDMGPIGATLNVHDVNNNTLAVTVSPIVDPATGVDQFSQPDAGKRFVAVPMTLSNQSSATISNDANLTTSVIGTDNQVYSADFNSVTECTNFNSGEFTMLAGGSEDGCVVFQLPIGVNVKAVQFSFDSAFLDTAQWNL